MIEKRESEKPQLTSIQDYYTHPQALISSIVQVCFSTAKPGIILQRYDSQLAVETHVRNVVNSRNCTSSQTTIQKTPITEKGKYRSIGRQVKGNRNDGRALGRAMHNNTGICATTKHQMATTPHAVPAVSSGRAILPFFLPHSFCVGYRTGVVERG